MVENGAIWVSVLALLLTWSTGLVYGSIRIVLWLSGRLTAIETAINTRVSTEHFKEEIDEMQVRVTAIERWALLLNGSVRVDFSKISPPDHRAHED